MQKVCIIGVAALLLTLGASAAFAQGRDKNDKGSRSDRGGSTRRGDRTGGPGKKPGDRSGGSRGGSHDTGRGGGSDRFPGKGTDRGPGRGTDHGPGRGTDHGPGRGTDRGPGRDHPGPGGSDHDEVRRIWTRHRANSFGSEHRSWRQRGGYQGYRIPDSIFYGRFGRRHWFRVYDFPYLVVGVLVRFQYDGYWFELVEPYPEYWGDDWYDRDDVYVDYVDDGYYLFNRRFPDRPGVSIRIYL